MKHEMRKEYSISLLPSKQAINNETSPTAAAESGSFAKNMILR